jgi:hypothetical protein
MARAEANWERLVRAALRGERLVDAYRHPVTGIAGTCRHRSTTTCTSRRCSALPMRSRMKTISYGLSLPAELFKASKISPTLSSPPRTGPIESDAKEEEAATPAAAGAPGAGRLNVVYM